MAEISQKLKLKTFSQMHVQDADITFQQLLFPKYTYSYLFSTGDFLSSGSIEIKKCPYQFKFTVLQMPYIVTAIRKNRVAS